MKSKVKWNNKFYVKVYQLAKAGESNSDIAKALGVFNSQLNNWIKEKPALEFALEEARKTDSKIQEEYIYNRLSGESKRVWDQICKAEKEDDSVSKIDLLLDQGGDGMRKLLFLHTLVRTHFNASQACRKVNVPYSTYKRWVEEDFAFGQALEQMQWHKGNLYESKIVKLAVEDEDPAALIYVNRTFNRKRGYGDKLEVEHTGTIKNDLTIELGENILDRLSRPARKEILDVVKQLQIEQEKGKDDTNNST